MRKHLYDENPNKKILSHPYHNYFFNRLEKILQEYWMHEVAKLLDPAIQYGNDNLSVDHILQGGTWSPEVKSILTKLRDNMYEFGNKIKPARNKLLSHKDKDVILSGESLGGFQEGDDVAFFNALRAYASEAHTYAIGLPYEFDDLTKNDVNIFISTFAKGLT